MCQLVTYMYNCMGYSHRQFSSHNEWLINTRGSGGQPNWVHLHSNRHWGRPTNGLCHWKSARGCPTHQNGAGLVSFYFHPPGASWIWPLFCCQWQHGGSIATGPSTPGVWLQWSSRLHDAGSSGTFCWPSNPGMWLFSRCVNTPSIRL